MKELDEVVKEVFIPEEEYQKIKKMLNKKDDFFSEEEFEIISVILA